MTSAPENMHKRLLVNVLFSSLSWFLPLLLGFVATPVIVKGLGYEAYGLYALIIGFIGYSFTFGIGRAVTKYVAEYRSEGKNEKIREIVSASIWFSLAIGLTGTMLVIVTAPTIVADILQIGENWRDTAVRALYLASGTVIFFMLSQIFQSVLQGVHRFDRFSILLNLNGLVLTAGNIALVLTGFGVNDLLWWNLAVTGGFCLLFFMTARRLLPETGIVFTFRKEPVRLVLKYGSGIIAYQVFANVLLLFERSWVIRHLGTEALTFYVVPMMLPLYLHGFVSSIVLVLLPLASELQHRKNEFLLIYAKTMKIVVLTVVFAAVSLISGNELLLRLWINEELAANSASLLIVHTVTFSLVAILTTMWQMNEAFGKPHINALLTFVWLVVSVGLMLLAVDGYGNFGVALARMTGFVIVFPALFVLEKKYFGAVQVKLWANMTIILSAAAAVVFAIEKGIFKYLPPTWPTLVTGLSAGLGAYVAVLIITKYFTRQEYGWLMGMIKR